MCVTAQNFNMSHEQMVHVTLGLQSVQSMLYRYLVLWNVLENLGRAWIKFEKNPTKMQK